MARQNYGFHKRQRELAKKQKREEKAQRRQERKEAEARGETPAPEIEPGAESAGEPEAAPAETVG